MTSRFHGAKKITSKQRLKPLLTPYKMSVHSIVSLISFFGEEQKSIRKGENHYKSGHVESFTYSEGILRGDVHASMRNKVYKVTVSGKGFRILSADGGCYFLLL